MILLIERRLIESREDKDTIIFVTERHPHQMRHSYATNLLNNGAPIEVIPILMGHENSETTRIYAELSGRLRKELYQKHFY
ncbi:tyrosine-type recombinase/integrase [Bacillus solitudinis]|uniref:tyrosine-type recombinase/integrase n=1 Tax=Bacillus solitudinis TaxID=2014074 RepID=UPI001D0D2404|nr:tyrosine-type recombinase/integrase [Bacillus solitudinis]